MAIQHQRRMRFMLLQHPINGPRYDRHLLRIDALLERNDLLLASGFAPQYRSGIFNASETTERKSRLGALRPLSTKLRWRCEIPVSIERSSWLLPRSCRQKRSNSPS